MADQKQQQALTEFYHIDNLVTVNIEMDPADWKSLREEEPKGGFEYIGRRYDWHTASKVTISGTKWSPSGPLPGPLTQVGIIKKSFVGSKSSTKPSLRLDFGKNNSKQGQLCEAAFGFKTLTLNNCKQDTSLIRQPLGYEIIRQAGVPYARCNLARVTVNGTDYGIYVNLEPMKKAFLRNNFKNDQGNLYEIEYQEDLNRETLNQKRISFEGYSKFENFADLYKAVDHIEKGYTAASQVIDMDALARFLAVEALIKHHDGYSNNRNNTYIYNDVVAVEKPDAANVKLKLIPCGIDMILIPSQDFLASTNSVLSSLALNNSVAVDKLRAAIRSIADTVFSRRNVYASLFPFVYKMEAILTQASAIKPDIAEEISLVKRQLRLVRTGGYQLINVLPTFPEATTWTSRATATALSASALVEDSDLYRKPAGYGVYHAPRTAPMSPAPTQMWTVVPRADRPEQFRLKNQQHGYWLFGERYATVAFPDAKATFRYYASGDDMAQDEWHVFMLEPVNQSANNGRAGAGRWRATGFYYLKTVAADAWVTFTSDLNARGRTKVVVGKRQNEATEFYFG
ncbi:coth protein-domain-containing protein [Cercophora newfieldiana]|uniref:Coth protein-domain-containing protein n=1 Tax=Cercophora newfieldiana TaxID=92897 RepID=A0AA39Y8N2_9PEZI|nr:coth protein-domain-containing protein [Cercophora newfieldiana]